MMKCLIGSKAVFGVLTILVSGMSSAMAGDAADHSATKKGNVSNYDEMVVIPAGKFIFGKPGATKEISLPAYSIDKYEVTNRQYAKFNLDHKYEPSKANYPVTMVSLYDANSHCEALDKRLPTEQEWEKAARGTDGRTYPWGNEFNQIACITSENALEGQPVAVGSCDKGASPYGAMDMAGNVWEWTASWNDRYSILRGGSFFEDRNSAMVFSALFSIPDDSKDYIGFRCVKDMK